MSDASAEPTCGECGAVLLPEAEWCVTCGARTPAETESARAESDSPAGGESQNLSVDEGSTGDATPAESKPAQNHRRRYALVAAAVVAVMAAGGLALGLMGGDESTSPTSLSVAVPDVASTAPRAESESGPADAALPPSEPLPLQEVEPLPPQELESEEATAQESFVDPGGTTRYVNSRFDYSIDVPNILVGQGESGNSDGQTFVSSDGLSRLAVWGGYNSTEVSVQEAYNRVLAEAPTLGRSVTHQASTSTKYTVSGYEANGDIYYIRSWLSEGREVTMEWEYPADMQPIIGPAIQQAADTIRVGSG